MRKRNAMTSITIQIDFYLVNIIRMITKNYYTLNLKALN